MNKVMQFIRWLCFWRKKEVQKKEVPKPVKAKNQISTMDRLLVKSVSKVGKQKKEELKVAVQIEQRFREHAKLQKKLGRGLTKAEWIRIGKKAQRKELISSGWFFKRDKQYFVNCRKIDRVFGKGLLSA